jgi:hypothetical protein
MLTFLLQEHLILFHKESVSGTVVMGVPSLALGEQFSLTGLECCVVWSVVWSGVLCVIKAPGRIH